jgi:hypothetical protein
MRKIEYYPKYMSALEEPKNGLEYQEITNKKKKTLKKLRDERTRSEKLNAKIAEVNCQLF